MMPNSLTPSFQLAGGSGAANEICPARRKLTVVMSADAVQYTTLMHHSEDTTLAQLKVCRTVFDDVLVRYDGRRFAIFGDSIMAELTSPVEAVRAAIEIQQRLADLDPDLPAVGRMQFRIGLHLGDVVIEGADLYGDGVNIAARVQTLAAPGGIAISSTVYEQVRTLLDVRIEDTGLHHVKGIAERIRIYRVLPGSSGSPRLTSLRRRRAALSLAGAVLVAAAAAIWWGQPNPAVLWRSTKPEAGAPRLAIMPFTASGENATASLLADGISADLATDLGRFRSFDVLSYTAFKNDPGRQSLLQNARADYVVNGHLQWTGGEVRANVWLVDARDHRQVWGERWERPSGDVLQLQGEITQAVAAQLPAQLHDEEIVRLQQRQTPSLGAYELWLEARPLFDDPSAASNSDARAKLESAIRQEPDFARAWGLLSYTYVQDLDYGWASDPTAAKVAMMDAALKALRFAPNDYDSHWSVGIAALRTGDYTRAIEAYDRAVELNHNDPTLLAEMSDALVNVGRIDQAIAQLNRAFSLNPKPPGWYLWNLLYAYFMGGQYDNAIATYEAAAEMPDEALAEVAAAYAMRSKPGDAERAAMLMTRFRAHNPAYTLTSAKTRAIQGPELMAHYLEGLRRAGLPD
ncbi:MAG: adenylate/guanylate cyclase domain-containing protein [Inquilinus sp.]|uniref:adenylate/guanylate cyclase domain-containing protein n=1 Tax=Inquilinus sp. TaxID=1932117 RepID=UPI003F3FEA44